MCVFVFFCSLGTFYIIFYLYRLVLKSNVFLIYRLPFTWDEGYALFMFICIVCHFHRLKKLTRFIPQRKYVRRTKKFSKRLNLSVKMPK